MLRLPAMQCLAPAFSPRAAQVLAGLPAAERPALWVADRLAPAGAPAAAHPTGFAALDAELPGGGWPAAGLTELLLQAPGSGELRLLAPLLGQANRHAGSLLCIAPPFILYAPALRALSLPLERLVLVTSGSLADAAWAAEQGLRSGACSAVLWWQGVALSGHAKARARKSRVTERRCPNPGVDVAGVFGSTGEPASAAALATVLRRLHLAAQESACPVFALRPASARGQSSPAPLRLLLEPQSQGQLAVSVFKRRGPAMAAPLRLMLPMAGLPVRRGLRRAALPPAAPARPVLPLPEPADVVVCAAPERIAA